VGTVSFPALPLEFLHVPGESGLAVAWPPLPTGRPVCCESWWKRSCLGHLWGYPCRSPSHLLTGVVQFWLYPEANLVSLGSEALSLIVTLEPTVFRNRYRKEMWLQSVFLKRLQNWVFWEASSNPDHQVFLSYPPWIGHSRVVQSTECSIRVELGKDCPHCLSIIQY
jgi:hypothetical protein